MGHTLGTLCLDFLAEFSKQPFGVGALYYFLYYADREGETGKWMLLEGWGAEGLRALVVSPTLGCFHFQGDGN